MGVARILGAGVALVAVGALAAPAAVAGPSPHRDKQATWTQVLENADASDTRWSARAGLQAVTLGSTVYVLGGRVPNEPPAPPAHSESSPFQPKMRSKPGPPKRKSLPLPPKSRSFWPPP